MTVQKWLESEVKYGRRILDSGLDGVRSGREAFLSGRPLTPTVSESLRRAARPAALGVCLGALASYGGNHGRSAGRVFTLSLLGGVIGLGAGVIWQNRRLTASALSVAWRNMGSVRDEHWLERHPIDYA